MIYTRITCDLHQTFIKITDLRQKTQLCPTHPVSTHTKMTCYLTCTMVGRVNDPVNFEQQIDSLMYLDHQQLHP